MNWKPPKLDEIHEGLPCQIIDKRASAEALQAIADVKKHFKRDVEPQIIFKDHVLTNSDIEWYKLHPELIKRDIRISDL